MSRCNGSVDVARTAGFRGVETLVRVPGARRARSVNSNLDGVVHKHFERRVGAYVDDQREESACEWGSDCTTDNMARGSPRPDLLANRRSVKRATLFWKNATSLRTSARDRFSLDADTVTSVPLGISSCRASRRNGSGSDLLMRQCGGSRVQAKPVMQMLVLW